MALLDRNALQKLKILAYRSSARSSTDEITPAFEAMYNPTEFSQKYETQYGRRQGIGGSNRENNFTGNKPVVLNLKLILDGTGVNEIGISLLKNQDTVAKKVNDFLKLAFYMDGDLHESRYLSVEWGDLSYFGDYKFDCRLVSVDITYTSFKADGTALRAELDVNLISDVDNEKNRLMESKSSPDLTHRRMVKSGDKLPLLCKEIYGNASHYLYVATENHLDDFRSLTPGTELVFPPLPQK